MFNLKVVQANYGDCLILEYGSDDNRRYALIDGGPKDTYDTHLKGELERISASGHGLDFIAISHVDSDHITGVLDLFTEMEAQIANGQQRLIEVSNVWHNSFAKTLDPSGEIQARFAAIMNASASNVMVNTVAALNGIWHGNQLRIKAMQVDVPVNDGFADDLVITDTAPETLPFGNLTLRIVGPSQDNLAALRVEWEDWLDKNEPNIAAADPVTMANADQSAKNLSSIMFLAEADGKTVLFTGDGRSDHLLEGLHHAGLLDGNGRMHIDVLKVPHHGSNRNATKTFFKKVTADTYVISANGHPDNPDLSTLIWIVDAAKEQNREITIVATNKTPAIVKLREEYPFDEYGYTLSIMPGNFHYKRLELA